MDDIDCLRWCNCRWCFAIILGCTAVFLYRGSCRTLDVVCVLSCVLVLDGATIADIDCRRWYRGTGCIDVLFVDFPVGIADSDGRRWCRGSCLLIPAVCVRSGSIFLVVAVDDVFVTIADIDCRRCICGDECIDVPVIDGPVAVHRDNECVDDLVIDGPVAITDGDGRRGHRGLCSW